MRVYAGPATHHPEDPREETRMDEFVPQPRLRVFDTGARLAVVVDHAADLSAADRQWTREFAAQLGAAYLIVEAGLDIPGEPPVPLAAGPAPDMLAELRRLADPGPARTRRGVDTLEDRAARVWGAYVEGGTSGDR